MIEPNNISLLRTTELEQVVEEDEDFYLEELNSGDMDGNDEKLQGGSQLGDSSTQINAASRASGQTRSISASSISSISSTGSIRTAKAEKRLNDKLSREGILRGVDPTLGMDLSPSEQRALQAEKRAVWRKARLKSLEQDAVQAQMVLNRMNELIDGSPTGASSNNQSSEDHGSTEKLDNDGNVGADEENNVSIVETTEQKIISIELDSPLKSPSSVSGEEPLGTGFAETPNSSGGNTNGGKRKKRKGSKKK